MRDPDRGRRRQTEAVAPVIEKQAQPKPRRSCPARASNTSRCRPPSGLCPARDLRVQQRHLNRRLDAERALSRRCRSGQPVKPLGNLRPLETDLCCLSRRRFERKTVDCRTHPRRFVTVTADFEPDIFAVINPGSLNAT